MTTKRALPPSAKSGEGEVRPDGLVSVSEILRWVERDRYLSPAETAEYLSISERSLRYLGIPRYRVGRLVRYRKSEVDSWMEKHRERPDELGALVDGALEGL